MAENATNNKNIVLILLSSLLDMMKPLCIPPVSSYFCASPKQFYNYYMMGDSRVPQDSDFQLIQLCDNECLYHSPKPQSARAEGCVGREQTPGQRLVQLTLINLGTQPLPPICSHPSTLRKSF